MSNNSESIEVKNEILEKLIRNDDVFKQKYDEKGSIIEVVYYDSATRC